MKNIDNDVKFQDDLVTFHFPKSKMGSVISILEGMYEMTRNQKQFLIKVTGKDLEDIKMMEDALKDFLNEATGQKNHFPEFRNN